MSNSDIFNEYVKIALEKGLVSSGHEIQKTMKNRVDSLSISDISALYGVKPDTIDSQEYENNIAEVAHKNSVIIAPSYDKLNGLVENVNECQNIMINIVNKPVNGLLTNRKYAHESLVKSIIRVANHMDNIEKEELRVLADDCIDELVKEADFWQDAKNIFEERGIDLLDVGGGATIGAIAGGLIGSIGLNPATIAAGALIGAGVGGTISALFATSPPAKNVASNAKIAHEQLVDVIEMHPEDSFLVDLDNSISKIIESAENYFSMVDKVHDSNATDQDGLNAKKNGETYIKQLSELIKKIDYFLQNSSQGRYEPEESAMWTKLKAPMKALVGGDVHDSVRAMQSLERVCKESISSIALARKEVQTAHDNAEQVIAEDAQKEKDKPQDKQKSNNFEQSDQFNDLLKKQKDLGDNPA